MNIFLGMHNKKSSFSHVNSRMFSVQLRKGEVSLNTHRKDSIPHSCYQEIPEPSDEDHELR